MPSTTSKTTTNHETIRRWAEARKAKPTTVARTRSKNDVGIIRLDFPGFTGEKTLAPITWDEFFEKFDDEGLAFVYQEKTAGGRTSNFNRFVKRSTAAAKARGARGTSARKATTRKPAATTRAAAKRTGTKRSAAKRTAAPTKRPAKRIARGTKKTAGHESRASRSGQKRGGARTRTTRARSRA